MKNLQKYFAFAVSIIMIVVLFNEQYLAQERNFRNKGTHLKKMMNELELTDDQKSEVKELLQTHRTDLKKFDENQREEFHNKILTVLNDEQKVKFNEMVANSPRAKMQNRFNERIDNMASELNLNEEQKSKLKEMMAERGRKFTRSEFRKGRKNCCCGNEFRSEKHRQSRRMRGNKNLD